jgi:uncharacterized membrane protein
VKLGIRLLGLGSVAGGVLDLIYGEFEAAHQPIQALGDHIPGVRVLAYVTGLWLVAGGLAIQWPRSRRAGAIALALIYSCFAAFQIPRFWTAPALLGSSWRLFVGLVTGPCVQLVPVAACVLVVAPSRTRAVRYTFAICAIVFGLEHLANPADVATMIPAWMPLPGTWWAVVTGICFVAAGVAFAARRFDVLAARLLAAMFGVFSALSLVPLVVAAPHDHVAWGGNAVNLAIIGATWLFADAIT